MSSLQILSFKVTPRLINCNYDRKQSINQKTKSLSRSNEPLTARTENK